MHGFALASIRFWPFIVRKLLFSLGIDDRSLVDGCLDIVFDEISLTVPKDWM